MMRIRIFSVAVAVFFCLLVSSSALAEHEDEELVTVRVGNMPREEAYVQLVVGAWAPFDDDLQRYYDFFPSVGLAGVLDLSRRMAVAVSAGYAYGEGNFIPGGSQETTETFLNNFWIGPEMRFMRRSGSWCRYYWGTGIRITYMVERFKEMVDDEVRMVNHSGMGAGWGLGFGADFYIGKSFTMGLRADLFLFGGNDMAWEGNHYYLGNSSAWLGLAAGYFR